jgi:transcriptional regulator with XRE-family HTH domain
MPTPTLRERQSGETDEHYAARLKRRAELAHQISEEIRFAAAGRGMTLAEVSRRMGDSKGRALASNTQTYSVARLADLSLAMGVTFRLVAIPDVDNHVDATGARPRSNRKLKPEDVQEIRRRVRNGETHRSVARDFGIGWSMISDIMLGKSYKDVPDVAA